MTPTKTYKYFIIKDEGSQNIQLQLNIGGNVSLKYTCISVEQNGLYWGNMANIYTLW